MSERTEDYGASPEPSGRSPQAPLRESLVEACSRIAELLTAFGERPEGEDQVVTEVTRECAYNVARTDLAEFHRVLGDEAEAALIPDLFPELVLPAAEADRDALAAFARLRADIEMPSAEGTL